MLLQNCFKVRMTISMSSLFVANRGRKRMRYGRKEALGDTRTQIDGKRDNEMWRVRETEIKNRGEKGRQKERQK